MEIRIKHCNNIDSAEISLVDKKLNIKFAPNGTGKSTIAKAIKYKATQQIEKLGELRPFKHRAESDPLTDNFPQVEGINSIAKIMCFDEDYVSQFTFRPDELLSNSYDIFIRTDDYKILEQEINNLIGTIKQTFTNNPDLEEFIANLKELGGAFTLTKTGLSKSSTGMKGLSAGNKIQHIPPALKPYQPFIQSSKSVNWIEWQTKGYKEFTELSDACPFCTADTSEKLEQISTVGKEYDKNIIKNLIGIIDIVGKLGDYFSEEIKSGLNVITSLKEGLEKEHETFIANIKSQIDDLITKLENIKGLSSFNFKEGDKVEEKLSSYQLGLQFFPALQSTKTQNSIELINASIRELGNEAGQLQGTIQKQRSRMQNLIEKYQSDINSFLEYAGYRYKVEIAGEPGSAQLKLLHIDHPQHLSGGGQHLSFGERNAFSIVLFMYECLAKKPDLIILDDPISSFDKNKKYAILEMLFRRKTENCLSGKTVLMLTHDVEPIIDTIKSVKDQFNNKVSPSFLKIKNGVINDHPIHHRDIKTFARICQSVIDSDRDAITKLIYLRRRCEILDDMGNAYQVLSNLFHLRDIPVDSRESLNEHQEFPTITAEKLADGLTSIKSYIPDFDYSTYLINFANKEGLKMLYTNSNNGYEKLQIFRMINQNQSHSVVQKFINETYHIENEFICQLDPMQFDLIPEYIIKACDKYLQTCPAASNAETQI